MDTLTPEQRSERMSKVRSTNTGLEMAVRRAVHAMGYRYRLHAKDLPGRPDMVFRSRRKVIFIHGCFWHGHDDPACRLARMPKSRVDFWTKKFASNHARDVAVRIKLEDLGWSVLEVWECQTRHQYTLTREIVLFLNA